VRKRSLSDSADVANESSDERAIVTNDFAGATMKWISPVLGWERESRVLIGRDRSNARVGVVALELVARRRGDQGRRATATSPRRDSVAGDFQEPLERCLALPVSLSTTSWTVRRLRWCSEPTSASVLAALRTIRRRQEHGCPDGLSMEC